MSNSEHPPSRVNRRQFLKLGAATVGSALVASSTFLLIRNESDQPVVESLEVAIRGLHPALDGFTIAVLSDFHLYPYTKLPLIDRTVAMTNALRPDVTVLLGDYVWHDVEAIFDLAPALAGLNARHGIFAIIGNHDIWTNVDVIITGLAEAGIPLLRNAGVPLQQGKGALWLAGLDDGWSGEPDLDAALEGRSAEMNSVLLLHEPDLATEFGANGRFDLQLSGHSHGGQVRLPLFGAPALPYLGWEYDMGLYRVGDMWLYTNRGLGCTNIPVRYNCAPEITHITLTQT